MTENRSVFVLRFFVCGEMNCSSHFCSIKSLDLNLPLLLPFFFCVVCLSLCMNIIISYNVALSLCLSLYCFCLSLKLTLRNVIYSFLYLLQCSCQNIFARNFFLFHCFLLPIRNWYLSLFLYIGNEKTKFDIY